MDEWQNSVEQRLSVLSKFAQQTVTHLQQVQEGREAALEGQQALGEMASSFSNLIKRGSAYNIALSAVCISLATELAHDSVDPQLQLSKILIKAEGMIDKLLGQTESESDLSYYIRETMNTIVTTAEDWL